MRRCFKSLGVAHGCLVHYTRVCTISPQIP